ncbi:MULTISPECIES: conjugative transposon protein TraM [Hymenobacter]|uniref:conjugative transposon protein TraM n=1 Tax=Hymenobacter TaxID=89966 RepID=UPI0010585D44|nr:MULTISPECIES: conjugative transposon protein TraM [Hymenobacter]QIL78251.1 conjugative transposon protein TraM [Hymenobacter sp. HDW8]
MATSPNLSPERIKQRRLLLFIPLPSFICLTALFYLSGGGQGVPTVTADTGANGLNLSLPAAGPSSLYEDKLAAAMAPTDSSYRQSLAFAPGEEAAGTPAPDGLNYAVQPGDPAQRYDPNNDPNVAAVHSRLQQLQQQTTPPPPATDRNYSRGAPATTYAPGPSSQDVQMDQSLRELAQLKREYEQRLQAMNTPATTAPAAKAAPAKAKPQPSVVAAAPVSVVNRLDNSQRPVTQGNSFHSLGGSSARSSTAAAVNTVPAVVHSDQVVVQGQTVKLRLLADVQLEGRVIPQNTVVYGVCNLSGQRLTIKVASIQAENSIVPVSLSAYDLDGGEGLSIPGSVERDAAQQGLAAGASSADLLTLSPSLGAQAAGIAIQTGKALTSRKLKQVKITLKANYKLLLH